MRAVEPIESGVATSPDGSRIAYVLARDFGLDAIEATCRAVGCPMLLMHGSEDTCQPIARSRRLSELTGAPWSSSRERTT